MSKPFSKQLGSTLAHLQDLVDTVFHGLLKSKNGKKKHKVITNIQDAGEAYYEPYTNIKKGNGKK